METMPEKVTKKYVRELLSLVAEAESFADKCSRLGIEKINLEEAVRQIRQRLEDLPVAGKDEEVVPGRAMYFVLSGGMWWPVHAGHETSACGRDGWLNFRTDFKDGSSDSGAAQPYQWAHCTADGKVNYHWFDQE